MPSNPFYINPEGKDIITSELKDEFMNQNPELAKFLQIHPISLKLLKYNDFEAFCFWILGQHISGKVADILVERLNNELGNITPDKILSTSIDGLRNLGISKPKSQYLHNLAHFFHNMDQFNPHELTSEELVEFFTQIKGIGEWTVQMHLIFVYGRLDIFSPKDLVVRKGLAKLYDLSSIPNVTEAKKIGSEWGNLATLGTILCWAVMGE